MCVAVLQADCAISHVPGIASYFCSFLSCCNNYGFAWLHNCRTLPKYVQFAYLTSPEAILQGRRMSTMISLKTWAPLVFLLYYPFHVSFILLATKWLLSLQTWHLHSRLEPGEGWGQRTKTEGGCQLRLLLCKALPQESQPVASAYILFSRTGIDGCSSLQRF